MKQKLLVIASYPPKNNTHHKSVVGGASYSKNTLVYLKNALEEQGLEHEITVLAEKLGGNKTYSDEGIKVKRFWRKNSLGIFPQMLVEIIKNHKKTKDILIEFEFAMFGEKLALLPLPLFVLALRLLGKRVNFVFHQVISDLGEMNGHLNIKKSGLRTSLLNLSLKSLYKTLTLFSTKIIVFDEILKTRLGGKNLQRKIAVISHGVEEFGTIPTKQQSRKMLKLPEDKYIMLAFGYLAWYKGTDWLAKAFSEMSPQMKKKTTLVIAGGSNPNHLNKDFYQRYIENLKKVCLENDIMLTGFIKEEEIPAYFQASDLVLFPYRVHMSASGPLSLALSFAKPFLVSQQLESIFANSDMKQALKLNDLTKKDLIFNKDLVTSLSKVQSNKKLQAKLKGFSETMKTKRIWDTIGKEYARELFVIDLDSNKAVAEKAYEISSTTSA